MSSEYRSKPDPENPWRYVCRECHGQVYRSNRTTTYRCRTCGSTWDREELVDKVEL